MIAETLISDHYQRLRDKRVGVCGHLPIPVMGHFAYIGHFAYESNIHVLTNQRTQVSHGSGQNLSNCGNTAVFPDDI